MTDQRQDDDRVQTKCDCGKWWQTERKDFEFVEAYNCDCGKFHSFKVPAKPGAKVIEPENADILAFGDDSDRLDTGMKVKEAVERARIWWERNGRREMQLQAKRQAQTVGGSNKGAGASFASQDPDNENFLPSGIIHGKAWDELTREDHARIVKIWHHFHIRKPDLLGEEQADHQLHERGRIQ